MTTLPPLYTYWSILLRNTINNSFPPIELIERIEASSRRILLLFSRRDTEDTEVRIAVTKASSTGPLLIPPGGKDAGIAEPSPPPWEGLGEAPPRYDAAYGTKRWTYERMRAVVEVLQSCLGEEK